MEEYDVLVDRLGRSMVSDYISVSKARNPVFLGREAASPAQLEYAMGQYTIFPKNIVTFLYSARDNARQSGWKDVDIELTRNLGEELGTETGGVPHYRMLVDGIKEDLGIDFSDLAPSETTASFVNAMNSCMAVDMAFSAGAVYALEATAVPELEIVVELTDALFRKVRGAGMPGGQLKEFFRMHLYGWEPGHESGLRNSCRKYITAASLGAFEQGFRDVMVAMDVWWLGLYNEGNEI